MKIRLQRFMADCGVASRRECEMMIATGRVRVNGEVRTEAPVMIDPEQDIVTVDDKPVEGRPGEVTGGSGALRQQDLVYYLLNKPKGILVTNYDPAQRKTVGELMAGVKERVFPVGRLDMDGRGALIMTNDGELANRLTHPRHGVEKTYVVEVDGRMSAGELEKAKAGVWLGPERPGAMGRGGRSERFSLKVIGRERGRTILEVKIAEGKNREIRRVMARLGHTVRDLNRVAIAGKITIKGVEPGKYRQLTAEEVKWLFHASSEEYHDRERAATQRWYEAKEMEKERKRLKVEAGKPKPKARAPQGLRGGRAMVQPEQPRRFARPKPAAWGQRVERTKPFKPVKPVKPAKPEIRAAHPLGDQAHSEE